MNVLPIIGWRKDAEGAGRFVLDHLKPRKNRTPLDPDTLAWIARWAGHWGRKELARIELEARE